MKYFSSSSNLLENATVFCISCNGVLEGHHFLTLVNCRPGPGPFDYRKITTAKDKQQRQFRTRTFSLPPSLEDEYTNDKQVAELEEEFVKLSRKARSLSDDMIIRVSRRNQHRVKLLSGLKFGKGKRKLAKKSGSSSRIRITSGKSPVVSRHLTKAGAACAATSAQMDGYKLSYFIGEMKRSAAFRTLFLEHWSHRSRTGNHYHQLQRKREGYPLLVFVAFMEQPCHEVLDLLGNKMVNSNILYRRSLEHALSWLSTLGGAFSALGDLSSTWAEQAGHVSLTQLRIALKLGDPGIQSRCRLYAAISLLQRGYLKSCRDMVKQEYEYATSLPVFSSDPRLRRMCLGVWAKLQYHWKLASAKKMLNKSPLEGWENIRNNSKYWNVYDLEEGRKIAKEEEKD